MLQKYDNWWQDKKLESDLEEQQRSNQVYNDPPKDNVGINLGPQFAILAEKSRKLYLD